MTALDDSTPTKTCTKCKECKPYTQFSKIKSSDGLRGQCKACQVMMNREWRLRDASVRANSERKSAIANARLCGMKPCKACEQIKPFAEFRKKSGIDKYESCCKECSRAAARAHYAENTSAYADSGKKYRDRNSEAISAKKAEYARKNRQATTDRQARWAKEKRKVDPLFALKARLRSMLSDVFRNGGYTKKAKAVEILGCDWHDLQRHIERQFTKGMSWENRGAWEIDHIVPLATAKTEADIISLNCFTNLRPMWAAANNAKGDTITHLI